jgi:Tfp pilus assembly protein PilO
MNAAPIDVPRLIRIATLLFSILAGTLVWSAYQPQVASLEARLNDDQMSLRSQEVAFAETPRLRAEREDLARHYGPLLAPNTEAVFLRELAATIRRHNVSLLSSSVTRDPPEPKERQSSSYAALFAQREVSIELRGAYRPLLATIGDLSHGSEIVRVDPPELRRDGEAVVATIPVTIYEPVAEHVP